MYIVLFILDINEPKITNKWVLCLWEAYISAGIRATNRKHDRPWRVCQQTIQCGSTEEEVASSAWKGMNKCVSTNPMSVFNKTDIVTLHKLARLKEKHALFIF